MNAAALRYASSVGTEVAASACWAGLLTGILPMTVSLLGLASDMVAALAILHMSSFCALAILARALWPQPDRGVVAKGALSAALTGVLAAVLIRSTGECLSCAGNLRDVVFYSALVGAPAGALHAAASAAVSKLWQSVF